jgi:flavorubredoxin
MDMETTVTEINDGIYRISTFIPDAGMNFNQFLVDAEEPLLFHTGHRRLFPVVSGAVATVVDPSAIRWLSYGHFEADECGAMNEWLAIAPQATPAQGMTGVLVSMADVADRDPRPLQDGEVLDLGGKRVRWIDTPHVPHGWDAGLLYEETTGTLLCGDLFTRMGDTPGLVDDDILTPAIEASTIFHDGAITPISAPTIRRLAELEPTTLGLMHGASYHGRDAGTSLRALADWYEQQLMAGVSVTA